MYVIIPVLAVAITLLVIQLLSRNTLQRIAYRCEVNMSLVEPDEVATLTYRVYNTSSWPIMFVSFSFQFRSDTTRRAFTFRGVAYEPVGHVGGVEWRFMRLAGVRTRVTTRYRTCGLQTTCPGVPTRSLARRPSPRTRFSPAWSDRRGRARLPYRRPPA